MEGMKPATMMDNMIRKCEEWNERFGAM